MKYRLTLNNSHCIVSSFDIVVIFLNCTETLRTPCISVWLPFLEKQQLS